MRGFGVGGLLAILLVGCGKPGPGDAGTDAGLDAATAPEVALDGPPVIVTGQLLPARAGLPYLDKVTARGTAPLTWSLPGAPSELRWISIDPVAGILSGTPPLQTLGEHLFTVQVRDGSDAGRSVSRVLALRLTECDDGARSDCFVPGVAACMQGSRTCFDGGWGPCGGTVGSSDVDACGALCASCGAGASACVDGRCACGAGPACSGASPTCCGAGTDAGCTHVLWDPDSCSACGLTCDAGTRLNVARVCDAGLCEFPCASARYGDCDSDASNGCETDLWSIFTCGGCNQPCTAPAGGWALCDAGVCGQACPAGTNLCPTNTGSLFPPTTCYPNDDRKNCGGCGNVCLSDAGTPSCVNGVCCESCGNPPTLCCAPSHCDRSTSPSSCAP